MAGGWDRRRRLGWRTGGPIEGWPGRLPGAVLTVLAAVLAMAAVLLLTAAPAGAEDGPEAQVLADRYVPVIMVRTQKTACGDGEPYRPTTVDAVLGKADVLLQGPDGQTIVAPTASDLYGKGPDWHVNLPGDALEPGCGYETWSRANGADEQASVYAKVTVDPDEPDRLALQFWIFWVFNDWNDRHESDWEMIQLIFPATTAAEALRVDPVGVGYAQHEGVEVADWDDTKLQRRDGTHPMVFSSQGSHASYYAAEHWLGKGAQTGFGCDKSLPASTELRPVAVLLPDQVAGPEDPFAWLTYEGRWGEKHIAFNNGPTGPNEKVQWATPVAWVDDYGREGSVALTPLGSGVTNLFCSASTGASRLFVRTIQQPGVVLGALLVLVAVTAFTIKRTGWRPGLIRPIASPRRAGQILNASLRLVAAHPRLMGGLGAILVVAAVVATGLQLGILDLTPAGDVADVVNHSSAWAAPIAHFAGAAITVPALCIVVVALVAAVRDLEQGRHPGVTDALREATHPWRAVLAALLLALVIAVTLGSVILAPLGLWLLVRWSLAPVVSVIEGLGVRASFHRSAQLTRHGRWRTLGVAGTALLALAFLGPFVGMVVLLFTDASLTSVNFISSLVDLVAVPVAAVAVTLLYYDRVAEQADARPATEPVPTA